MCGDALQAQEVAQVPTGRGVLGGWRPAGLPATSGCDSSDCAYCQALARLRQPSAEARAAASGCWLRRKRSRQDLAGMAEASPCSSGCGGDDGEACTLARVPSVNTLAAVVPDAMPSSLWDHALLVEQPAAHDAWQQQQQQQQRQHQQQQRHRGRRRDSESPPPEEPTCSGSSSGHGGASLGSQGVWAAAAAAAAGPAGALAAATSWHPSWQAPAALRQVGAFLPPAHCHAAAPSCCTDIVCALEFEEHGWLLASAGVSKQVRVYSLASQLERPDDEAYQQPLRCHRMASKLSSLAWNPDAPGAVTVADYDGVVSQVDMESGHLIAEVDEHGGRRVWSVSHSLQRPNLCASASEDGTVRLWGGPALQQCVAALAPGGARRAPACGVQLSPFDGDLAAVACADHSAYIFDLRRADQPLLQLSGHGRAVSYVRWLGARQLVTASTDASLAVWQLPGLGAAGSQPPPGSSSGAAGSATAMLTQPWKRLRGHRNSKNFCGLSVRPEDGLVACGSEAPTCYAYHASWASPLASCAFGGAGASGCLAEAAPPPDGAQFCSAVCWQPATARPAGAPPLLAAALSTGELRVLELRRPAAEALQRRCMDG